MLKSIFRRARGALGNALVWGAAWFGTGFAFLMTLFFAGQLPEAEPWRLILYVSANFGATGFLTGGAFSVFIRLAYHDRHIPEIRVTRFALGGAVVAALFGPMVSFVARLSAGLPVSTDALIAGSIWAPVLGGLTACITIKVAQLASRRIAGPQPEQIKTGSQGLLPSA